MIKRTGVQLLLMLLLSLLAVPAFAQSTTAALGGRVTSSGGEPVAGAEVVIVHTPSGTTSRATTGADGRFISRSLRVGGPYTVSVVGDGYRGAQQENVYLLLNETANVALTLVPEATDLETIEVIASTGSDMFSPDRMGAGTSVSNEQIQALPSIGRNIQDYARLDPRVAQTDKQRGEISVGGQNTRFNNIRIDGVSTNDPFGLESNNLPTLRQPVSIDAIDQVQISVAEYDVNITGATGGVINAVTKSGTNDFSGSVYYVYRENDWVRDNANGTTFEGFKDEETYGMTFGGPLIKDTLFFFINYEKFTRNSPGPTFGPVGSGASNIVNITPAQIAEIQQIARDVWGFEPGSLDIPAGLKTDVEEYAVKFDWNITEDHRASYRYSKTEQTDPNIRGLGNTSLSLNSHWDSQVKTFESHVLQVFSDWNDSFSTEFKASYREYASIFDLESRLPQIRVNVAGSTGLLLGTEQFRHVNILTTEETNLFAAGRYYVGDHEIKFGADWTSNDIFNLFGRDLFGVYTFQNIDQFRDGTPNSYASRAPFDGNVNSIAADWTLKNLGFFVQDTWSVNYNLSLMFGLRVDTPIVDDRPLRNNLMQTLYGLDNTQTIDGNELIQPRFGFNYTFDWSRPTQLRGGLGLFQGSAANVWLSNPFSNTGLNFIVRECTNFNACNNAGVIFNPNPDNQPNPSSLPPRQAVDIVSSDLGQPSVWKANLAFEHELPWWGVVASAEAIFTNVKEGIFYEKLDIGAATRAGQDGRMMYWNAAGYNPANFNQFGQTSGGASARANRDSRVADVTYARPTSKGESQQLTLALTRPLDQHWSWQVAYTFTNATEVNPLTSSQAVSNWNNNAIFQVNEEVSSRTNYMIRDRFTGNVAYRNNFFGDYKTEVAMFYEGRKGKPYSWVFFNDMNGDGRAGNDLFYVPSGPGDVVFGSAAEEQAFFEWLSRNPSLARFAGQVVPRNSEFNPWVNTFDIRISQELPGFFRGHKSEIWLDIMNVGNLINKDWGRIEEIGFPSTRRVAYYGGVDPTTGRYIYRFQNNVDNPSLRDVTAESRWALQLGFRYRF
jgi:outer membrane receptor for ferrienterochelin and colicin